jgi:hypothetical protein
MWVVERLVMSIPEALLPREAKNDYRGGRVPFYTFCLLSAIMFVRGMIHFLKDDSGVNSMATIVTFSGAPDPNQVLYMFSSLWGTQKLITVLIYAVELVRYRNLVPLMYLLFVVEVVLRTIVGTLHPLTEEILARVPPVKLGNAPLLALTAIMLFLSIRSTLAAGTTASPAQSPRTWRCPMCVAPAASTPTASHAGCRMSASATPSSSDIPAIMRGINGNP